MTDQPPQSLPTREKVVKAAGWSALQSWGARVISLTVFVLLARLLEPQHFGLAALAMVFTALIQSIVEQSFGEAIIQRADLTPKHLHTAFWTNGLIGCALAAAMMLSAGLFASLLHEPDLAPIIRGLAVCCAITGFASVPEAMLRRSLGYRALALRAMVATLVSGIVAVVCASLGLGVWSLVIQNIVYSSLCLVLVWIAYPWRPRLEFSFDSALELGRFAIHSLGAIVGDFMHSRLIDMLIGYHLGTVALGYYSIGYKLVTILNQMLTQVTTTVSLSTFSRMQHDPARMRQAFYEATQMTCFFAIPAFVALSLLAHELVPLLFGATWEPAVPLLQILAYLGVIFAVGNLFSTVATASGRPDLRLYLIMLRVLTAVVLFYATVDYGLVAISAGYTLAAMVMLPLGFYFARRLIGINFNTYALRCLPMLTAMAAMILMHMAVEQLPGYTALAPTLRLLLSGFAILLVYVFVVLILERTLLARLLSIGQLMLRRSST
ncbi:MAG: lipopolysaccharide biosynthesis protein [Spongiibacteraceae bacterium]